jgi:hypothetical protein
MTHAVLSRLASPLAGAVLVSAALAACSKDAPPADTTAAPIPADSAPAPAPTPEPTVASTPAPAPAPAPTPTPAPASATAKPAASAKPAPACGDKPLPPCPLYAWMKSNTSPAMSDGDFDALAAALDKVVTFAPAGYTNWASISRDGASAAHAQSLDGVKAACRGCHNQYKDKYKKEMRDRPI